MTSCESRVRPCGYDAFGVKFLLIFGKTSWRPTTPRLTEALTAYIDKLQIFRQNLTNPPLGKAISRLLRNWLASSAGKKPIRLAIDGAIVRQIATDSISQCLHEDLVDREGVTEAYVSVAATPPSSPAAAPAAMYTSSIPGLVKIEKVTESGKDILLGVVAPGELFGEQALLGEGAFSVSARVLEVRRRLLHSHRHIPAVL